MKINFNEERAIDLPISKSIGARYLVATYFAGTLPADPNFANESDDLRVIEQALLTLYADEQPIDYGNTPIDVEASGTALRFVTAVCASTPEADFVVTGTDRLLHRPIKPLIEVLRKAGADIECLDKDETGPYRVAGHHLEGGEFSIVGNVSSQFISAVILCAPTWKKGARLNFTTPLVSKPYIEMTARVMERFGIKIKLEDEYVEVPHAAYIDPEDFKIEADWSSAAFFFEAAAINPLATPVSISGLSSPAQSLQGDSLLPALMQNLGVTSHFSNQGVVATKEQPAPEYFECDMKSNPDLVPALTLSCCIMGVKFKFIGVATLRYKESDRLEALKEELNKRGFVVETGDDFISWAGITADYDATLPVDPHDDHRIAMAFAVTPIAGKPVIIEKPNTVTKSFPLFWEQMPKLGLKCTYQDNDTVKIEKT